MKTCVLCNELSAPNAALWNLPLLCSENFVALPSLGALVEGWLLLVPKDHFVSIGALPDCLTEELNAFKRVLHAAITDCYGQVTIFEHGPCKEKRNVGCGVDHAHIHFVPVSFDLATLVQPLLPSGSAWKSANINECRNSHIRGEDYLYVEQPIGAGRIVNGEMGSQLFRRAIATAIGAEDRYNWREYPHLENVLATIRRIQTWQESARSGDGGVLFAAA